MRPLLVPFPSAERAALTQVGGKGASLIRLSSAGLPVPPGAVFTSAFFAPWFDEVKATSTWIALMAAPVDAWETLCDHLKASIQTLPLTAAQRDTLDTFLRDLTVAGGTDIRLAVRSSSPEEDLASASFAGVYETRLGVRPSDLEGAVRDCFASSLDARVLSYKREHGFDVWSPRFAAIAQRQIDSEVAGVGFSLNPMTNDYDEAVIDANWGLGTSVVEGRVSPDHFVVNKVTRQIVEETRGDKQLSVWLDPDGGTRERQDHDSGERALTNTQLRELTETIARIEALYEAPVDIEWAYAGGDIYVLQARPITTYVPLPPEMVTAPSERRRLYADAALSKGLTINRPISPLGLDFMEGMFSTIIQSWIGPFRRDAPPKEALFFFAGARMYVNYSNLMWLASPESLSKSAAPTDALMAAIVANLDPRKYRSATRPPWVGLRLIWLVPRLLWRLRGFLWTTLRTVLSPERAYQTYERKIERLQRELRRDLDKDLPLDEIQRECEERLARNVFGDVMPFVLVGIASPNFVPVGETAHERALADKLQRGVTGDVVVEMGIALHRLARLVDPAEFDDLPRLIERIEQRRLSPEFLSAWDDFLARFGWRGPLEMDVASPRYADDPRLALRQMSFMAPDGFDPEAAHRLQVEGRQRAYEVLMRRSGLLTRALLRRVHRLSDLFAGTRDTPKHLIVLCNYLVRKRALIEGRRLTQESRLDAPEEVFDLTFEDLKAAAGDRSLDLRRIRDERTNFPRKLRAHVTSFPPMIDSRGRILRPPAGDDTPGVLKGTAVSPGVVTGRVKVLRSPDEKPIERGDVLVAYTTDPGWTPLFVNAAAILLQVGGVLQHGAVVAREFGKPCVVGIDGVVSKLHDGDAVEVDGTTGTVRLLS